MQRDMDLVRQLLFRIESDDQYNGSGYGPVRQPARATSPGGRGTGSSFKNPAAPAVEREAEEDWVKVKWRYPLHPTHGGF